MAGARLRAITYWVAQFLLEHGLCFELILLILEADQHPTAPHLRRRVVKHSDLRALEPFRHSNQQRLVDNGSAARGNLNRRMIAKQIGK